MNVTGASLKSSLSVIAISLLLLAVLTAALAGLQRFTDVQTVTTIYLIAVLFAAIRGGVVPAVVSAVAAIGAAAFFFYPPIYDFRVHNPIHLVDLVLFIIVAVVTGKLATDVRKAKMREQTDALREALIGSVSHELRTPLSSIMGAASVLAQSPDIARNLQLNPLVQGLREEAQRLDDNIQNLLDATRISNEGIRPNAEWVDPSDIVNAAIERKRRLLSAHQLSVSVADDLPLVQLDPMLIEKALGQLIENAVKYSPQASAIEIQAEQSHDMVRIAVQDRGIGMSGEECERMWERFYRAPRHRDSIPGSGLGLWIAQALVAACNGHMEAFSAGVGQGATVAIYLPVVPRDSAEPRGASDE
jgi:two-component system sensor histidine kinase KdpD